jgi:hypothetical protein
MFLNSLKGDYSRGDAENAEKNSNLFKNNVNLLLISF